MLAGLSIVGGIIQLPNVSWLPDSITERLEHWLAPVVEVGERSITGTWGDSHKTILMLIATAGAVLGIVLAWLVYEQAPDQGPVEPVILANGWYYDQAVTDFMGGPGRAAFEDAAWFDRNVVDGAVNGAGRGRSRHGRRAAQGPDRLRARTTPGSSASVSCCCSAGSSSCGECCSARVVGGLPDPHRDRAGAGGRRARRGPGQQAPPRVSSS